MLRQFSRELQGSIRKGLLMLMLNRSCRYTLTAVLLRAMVSTAKAGEIEMEEATSAVSPLPKLSLAPAQSDTLPDQPAADTDSLMQRISPKPPGTMQRYPQPPVSVSVKPHKVPHGKKSSANRKKLDGQDIYESGASKLEVGKVLEQPLVVLPEVTTTVKLSSSDVNRFVCTSGEIDDVPLSSEEKGVVIKYSGKDVFVKFKVSKDSNGDLGYSTTPTEIFIVCGGSTYSVIAFPSRVPSQTVRLGTGVDNRVQENRSLYAGLPFEKKVMRIIKEAYTDNIPESYTVAKRDLVDSSWKGMYVTLKREIDVDGEGLHLKEYHIAHKPGQLGIIKLSEKMFLRKEFAINPLAVSIDKHKLKQNEVSRLFIVEQRAEQPLGGNGFQLMSIDSGSPSPTQSVAPTTPSVPKDSQFPKGSSLRSRMPQNVSEGAE